VSNVRYADTYRFSFSPSPTKAGFGLGALNEAEDDDIDVYDSTTHADRTYMPYDAIRDADDGSSVRRGKLVQKVVSFFLLPIF
jgi:G patch domain-containing protein 1